MLRKLIIRNFAIIDELSIDLSDELNLVTGETGAGKSIIVGALSLLLGGKVDSKALFKPGSKCIIEGQFLIENYGLKEIFEELDLDYSDETVLRREISLEGKSRAFINDSPVGIGTLQDIGNRLVDIHSQHETLDINQESFQVRVLDSVSGQISLYEKFKNHLSDFRKMEKKISLLQEAGEKNKSEMDFIQFQIDELEKAKLIDPEEQERLENELLELTHAEEIQKGLFQFISLTESEEESVLNRLKLSLVSLQGVERFYPPVRPFIERIKANLIEIRDIFQEVETLSENIVLNASRMEEVQSRLNLFYHLEQKHRVSDMKSLIQVYKGLQMRYESLSSEDDTLRTLEIESGKVQEELRKWADILSEQRNKSIPKIEKEIKKTLVELGIKDGEFQILLETKKDRFTSYGWDRVRFLFSANKGFAPSDLSKVASGGELSRLVLAIKTLSSNFISMPTLLFDEIDTGVSGEVAMKVGRVMKKLSLKNQVIAITHLPQIASREGTHFLVFKDTRSGISRTQMEILSPEVRIKEIAKMLSGNNPGEFALKNARELMENA